MSKEGQADFNQADLDSDVYRDRKRLLVTIFSQPTTSCLSHVAKPNEEKNFSEKKIKENEKVDVDLYELYHNLFGNYFCLVREKDITYEIGKSFDEVKQAAGKIAKSKAEWYDVFLFAFLTFHSCDDNGGSLLHFSNQEARPVKDVLALFSSPAFESKPKIFLIQADLLNVNFTNVKIPQDALPGDSLIMVSTVPQQQTSLLMHAPITQPLDEPEGKHTAPNPRCSPLVKVFDKVMTDETCKHDDMQRRAEKLQKQLVDQSNADMIYVRNTLKKVLRI